jgi:hypothetical protein
VKAIRLLLVAAIITVFTIATQGRAANAAASFTFTGVVTSATCDNSSFSALLEFNNGLGTAFTIDYTDTVSAPAGTFSYSGTFGSYPTGLYNSLVGDSAAGLGIPTLAYPYTVSETLTATDGTTTYWTTISMTCSGGAFGGITVTSGVTTTPVSSVPPALIPSNFVQRTITCTVALYSEPSLGSPISGAKIIQGQRWYVNPTPVTGKDGKSWTVIFPGGNSGLNAFIPTACVGAG